MKNPLDMKLNLSLGDLIKIGGFLILISTGGYKFYNEIKALNHNLNLIVEYFEIDPHFKAMKDKAEGDR